MKYTLTGRFYFLLGTLFAFLGLCLLVFAAPNNPNGPIAVSAEELQQTQNAAKEKTLQEKPPIGLLVFDEFPTITLLDPRQEINKKRFPHFSLLSKEGRWYKNHTTVSESTFLSVPSILSGKYPEKDTYPLSRNYPNNLFSYLDKAGYDIYGRELITELCEAKLCKKLGKKIGKRADGQEDYMSKKLAQVGGRGRLKNESWIQDAPMTEDMFFFLHAQTPHQPYHFLPSGQTYNNPNVPTTRPRGEKTSDLVSAEKEVIENSYQRALLQVGYADYLVGKFIRKAKRAGIWDEMLFVVVADHGSGWIKGDNRRYLSDKNMGSVAFAPLFIKYPGNSPSGTSLAKTQNIDILPTILKTVSEDASLDGVPAEEVEREIVRINNKNLDWDILEKSFEKNFRYTQSLARQSGGIYQLDENSDLIGEDAKSLLLIEATVDFPRRYIDYSRKDAKIPSLISGSSSLKRGSSIAVAMKGEVVATGKVLDDDGLWAAIIKPQNLKDTEDIQVYQIN